MHKEENEKVAHAMGSDSLSSQQSSLERRCFCKITIETIADYSVHLFQMRVSSIYSVVFV